MPHCRYLIERIGGESVADAVFAMLLPRAGYALCAAYEWIRLIRLIRRCYTPRYAKRDGFRC